MHLPPAYAELQPALLRRSGYAKAMQADRRGLKIRQKIAEKVLSPELPGARWREKK
jgi:hypothetical protein